MAMQFLASRNATDPTAAAVRSFESATAEVIAKTNSSMKQSMLYLVAGFFLFVILFMSFAKLDRIVVSKGSVIPIDGSLVIQPFDKAIVRSVLVHEGDLVRKNQILAKLDPTFAAADLLQLTQKVGSLRAEVSRLHAEVKNQPWSATGEDSYQLLQLAIWRQRQAQFAASLSDYDERISSSQTQITRLAQTISLYGKRLGVADQIEGMRKELERRQVGSHLNSLVATDQRIELSRSLGESENQLSGGNHDLASLKAQRAVYIEKWRAETVSNLVTKQNELDQATQELTKAQKLQDLVDVQSPVDAIVVKVATVSSGSVAKEAEPLFTLVPLDAPLEAQVEIDAKDVGFVRAGDPVRLKFEAFRFLEHGTAAGVIKTISEDAFTQEPDGTKRAAFYQARVLFTDIKLHNVPKNFRLIPGMTLQGDIVVGRRTIMSYLIEGALRTGAEAMREP